MGSNGAFHFWLAFSKPNKVYSDFLCARLDKLNAKALNDQPTSIDEWPRRPPCSRGDPSTKWRTSLKGRAHKCPDFSACLFHFLSQTTGHQMRLTYWKIMFYGRVVKNKMEALALLSNSNLLVLSDPKGFDFPPSWKLLVSSKGVPLTGQTYLMWEPLGGGRWTSPGDFLTSRHSDSRLNRYNTQ